MAAEEAEEVVAVLVALVNLLAAVLEQVALVAAAQLRSPRSCRRLPQTRQHPPNSPLP